MKKFFLYPVILCLSICLAACSSGSSDSENKSAADALQNREWIYVPERISIPDSTADYGRMQLCGDTVCYITSNQMEGSEDKYICKYSLTEKELQKIPIVWEDDGASHETCCYTFDAEGNAWFVATAYSSDYTNNKRFLYRFDVDGKVLFRRDVTEQLLKQAGWITNMAVDSQNRIYVFDRQNGVWLYDDSGTFCGNIPYENHRDVQEFGAAGTPDGRLLVCLKKESDASSCTLSEIRFEEKKIVDIVKEFPLVRGICAGEGDALWMYDETLVYEYSLDRQETKVLFPWSDGEINGYYACGLSGMQDGGIFCAVEDYTSDDRNVVLLTKCKAEDVPSRALLVLAMVSDKDDYDESLSGSRVGMAMKLSRNSSSYHITIKKYDSLESLYLALLTGGNIDLIDLSGMRRGVNIDNLCRQGVLADLSPYLKQSGRLSKDSFVDGILNAYSYGDRLVGIPDTFALRTLAGDSGMLKNKDGLTLSEFYDISKNTGEKVLVESYAGVSREEMLQYLLLFSEELFIDWEKKECHYDSAEFGEILELAALFPEQAEYMTEDGVFKRQIIDEGGAVFAMADLSYPKAFQAYEHAYGENAALVGFPTPDGSGGSLLLAGDAFGVTANSRYPDEAWEFIEDFLCRRTLDGADPEELYQSYAVMGNSRYPARKDILEYMVDYRIEQDRLQESKTGVGLSNWEPGYHSLTKEEVNAVMELLPHAKPYRSADGDVVLQIISEEAGAYYSGQKPIEEVARIIQNRVQVYVNEQDVCLPVGSFGAADGETAEPENSQNPVMTDGPQGSPEPSGQEPGAEAEPSASAEEPSSDAGETEESEFDTLPRWTFAEIADAKAGDIVTFGTYEQDNDAENGAEPIEWFILDMEDGQATLLSVYLLDCQRYHPEETAMTWEDCTLRAWLNDDFLNAAFTKAEQEHIAVTKLVNGDNPVFGTPGGNDTSDKIWLLSLGDVEKYFHISVEEGKNPYIKDNHILYGQVDDYHKYCCDQDYRVLAKPTAYAIQQGCHPVDIDEDVAGVMDEEFRAEMEELRYASGCALWWLRSPGDHESYASDVANYGGIYFGGAFLNWKQGVRPALTVTYYTEPSGREPGAEAELSAEAEEPSSDAGEAEESEFDTLSRWTFAEIADAKAGDIVTFGTYEQDNDAEPIEWFILDMEDGQATLLSVYLLDCQRYHPEDTDMTWEDCALRAWLNDDFLNAAFTKAEQEHIAVTKLVNEDNPVFGTQGGNDTSDKIWLLSLGDLEKYFHISIEEGRKKDTQSYIKYCYDQDHRVLAKPTAYAIQQGCYPFDVDESVAQAKQWTGGSALEEFRVEMEEYRYASGCADWWLRSPAHKQSNASCVGEQGRVYYGGIFVSAKYGVRPALKVTY